VQKKSRENTKQGKGGRVKCGDAEGWVGIEKGCSTIFETEGRDDSCHVGAGEITRKRRYRLNMEGAIGNNGHPTMVCQRKKRKAKYWHHLDQKNRKKGLNNHLTVKRLG